MVERDVIESELSVVFLLCFVEDHIRVAYPVGQHYFVHHLVGLVQLVEIPVAVLHQGIRVDLAGECDRCVFVRTQEDGVGLTQVFALCFVGERAISR